MSVLVFHSILLLYPSHARYQLVTQQGDFTLLFAAYVCISLNILEFYSAMQLYYSDIV